MADVRAMQGLHFVAEQVGNLAEVIAPPYDVISREAQARYYQRNPWNIIRIELGEERPTDSVLNNVYTRAASTWGEWRLQGIVEQERQSCYYVYQQRFQWGGKKFSRTSLLARVKVEPWSAGVVLPHEQTLAKAKSDRLQLYRACATNTSPIMCLYDDPQARLRKLLTPSIEQASVRVTDEVGEEHILQPIRDLEHIALIQDFFAPRQLYIADGHHRYETALSYREEILEQRGELHPDDGVNFTMMALIDIDDPGMLVLPTHRLLTNLSEERLKGLAPEALSQYFEIQELDGGSENGQILQRLQEGGERGHALVVHTAERTLVLNMNAEGERAMGESGRKESWNELDVAIAQRLVLEKLVGLQAEDMTAGTYVHYAHESEKVFEEIKTGKAQAAILLNATPLQQMREVARDNERMPQKSTFLYPKLITGLVMNPLW